MVYLQRAALVSLELDIVVISVRELTADGTVDRTLHPGPEGHPAHNRDNYIPVAVALVAQPAQQYSPGPLSPAGHLY